MGNMNQRRIIYKKDIYHIWRSISVAVSFGSKLGFVPSV
jgi:hypothetical protein